MFRGEWLYPRALTLQSQVIWVLIVLISCLLAAVIQKSSLKRNNPVHIFRTNLSIGSAETTQGQAFPATCFARSGAKNM